MLRCSWSFNLPVILNLWLQEQSFLLVNVLRLAVRLTETLGQVHAANIIHKTVGVGSTFTLRLPLVARPPAVEPGARGALAA